MFRITELSIAAVSVVCMGLFGCGGDGDGSSGGAVSGGSGKVVSCDVKTSQAGYEAESCTEVPESSPAAEPFKQACGNQSVAGVTTTTVGSGCPAAQKKCTIGEQTVYYYGEAAKYAQCADVGNDSGSSNNSGTAQTGKVYSCNINDIFGNYCMEISESTPDATTFQANCNLSGGTFGTGCPVSTKKCPDDKMVTYFYDAVDLVKSCDELMFGASNSGDGKLPTISGTKVSLYYVVSEGGAQSTYCLEYGSESSSSRIIAAEKANCNEMNEYSSVSCKIGTGCPSSAKICGSELTGGLKYFYDQSDMNKSCATLM